jgi:Protein of unknown function (DUF1493)
LPRAEKVTEFIANEAGVPVDSITRQTRLWHDLRLGGDDAVEVFTRYQAQFGVDLASLQLTQHVPSEITVWYVDAWESLARILRFLPSPRYVPITVDDLVRAAEAKTWDVVRHRNC